jgi:hypothetical protein
MNGKKGAFEGHAGLILLDMITSLELDCNSGLELGIPLNSVHLPLCVGSLRHMDLGLSIDRFDSKV